MKILFFGAARYDEVSFTQELTEYPELHIDFIEENLNPLTATFAQGYDAVCAFVNADAGAMTLEILAELNVKLLLMRCAGFDAVNVEAAKELGLRVVRVPAYSPEAIAEHAMGLALCANRRIHKGYIRVRENNFSLGGLVGTTLFEKTAGIIGTGRIGAALCRICKGFGMRVVGYDMYPNEDLIREGCLDAYVSLEELLASSDLISLHTFLDEQSHHMINAQTISAMKDGVIFVNTSRGGLVDTEALIDGLLSGKIGAAGLDVYDEEGPNVYQNRAGEVIESITARLCSFPNVVLTSHQAFFTEEALAEIARTTLDNARAWATGADFIDNSVVC